MSTQRRAPFTYAAVLVCVAGFVACSSTTTGNGTGTGGKTGLFGGGSGGTSGTASGGAATVPKSCTAAAADDSCTACLKKSCCASTLDCANQTECNAVFTCASTCSSQTCTDNCIAAHPNAEPALRVFVACEQQFCVAACGGSSSSTSGGATGTSGGSSVCQLASDQSVCANETGHTTAEDCPGGPPTAQCFAAPTTGISNVYCCPP